GTTPGHASVTLPVLGNLTGALPGLPGGSLPGLPGLPGGSLPGGTLPGGTTPGGNGGTSGGTAPGGDSGSGALPGGTTIPASTISHVASQVQHGLNAASMTSAASTLRNIRLAQTGSSFDPFLLFAGVLLLAGGAAVKLIEQR
ncbi:LPXTG cell wall anchor domain-containing protein, partial [Microbacterium sp. 22242]|uniref:LPXTG cell wall anchor domain-containing protein n=1 Tax=Microbacterium sp. 22242 TaxID=3453896 RepID=UPI003F84D08E